MDNLRGDLDRILAGGLADDPVEHARQVAEVAAVFFSAFQTVNLGCTLVGGSAIEIHAPGIFKSGDIDVVIEASHLTEPREHIAKVFVDLGFEAQGRHWCRGDLFVEVPSLYLEEPSELLRLGKSVFRIVTKEVLLADRIVGFKHCRYTGYGEQAIEMIAAFGSELDMDWLIQRLDREDSIDAFRALEIIAMSSEPVTERGLQSLLASWHLRRQE